MRYRINLSYDGSQFCGWQIQSKDPSVQGCIEDAIARITGCHVGVTGAGRTDTGVNAVNYVAHFDWPDCAEESQRGPDCADLAYRLNAVLPKGIAIHSIQSVPDTFHARFSATCRQYKYFIHKEKDPFLEAHSWYCRFNLDIDAMNRACELLPGVHDCSCFEKKGSDNATSLCDIKSAHWDIISPSGIALQPQLVFTVEANRFLRNMVRAIVGTMIDIGRGLHGPEYINELFKSGNRSDAGQSVPGHALFLTRIDYPE